MAAKPRAVVVIGVVAIAIAAIASWLLYNYLREQQEIVKEAVATEQVVVASKDIPVGTTIERTQIKVVTWPKANVPERAVLTEAGAVGRVALQGIQSGDPITEAKLVPRGGAPGILTYKIPEGHRAMTVGVDQVSGVAGFITPGNMVDVVLTHKKPASGQGPMSKIILQNIPVLATGQIIEQEAEGKPVIVPTVTLDVTPDEAERLALASVEGRLQLLLRKHGDKDVFASGGATISRVIGAAPAGPAGPSPRVAKAAGKRAVKKAPVTTKAAGARTINVEVLRDGNKQIETFKVQQ